MDQGESSMIGKSRVFTTIKSVDTTSLKALADLFPASYWPSFTQKYGKIARLLTVDIQIDALLALVQFYDPPLRCFLFRDFILGPTLEELEALTGWSLQDKRPYKYSKNEPSMESIARVFKVSEEEVKLQNITQNKMKGFRRYYLEQHMSTLAKQGDWETFGDILALAIFGLVLFPSLDNLVSLSAVDVFMACKLKGESPVPALLADIYVTMHINHVKNGRRLICCLPILYVWFTSHVIRKPYIKNCPIDHFHTLEIEKRNRQGWIDFLLSLNGSHIRWFSWKEQYEEVLCYCGDYPNVPLMGTLGCINYNPSLVHRQLGYTVSGPPVAASIASFELIYHDNPDPNDVNRVHSAWRHPVRKSKDLGKRNVGVTHEYLLWVQERVRQTKLPDPSKEVASTLVISDIIETEEVKTLKNELATWRSKCEKVEEESMKIQSEYSFVKRKFHQIEESQAEIKQRIETEKKQATLKFREALKVSNKEKMLLKEKIEALQQENMSLREIRKNKEQELKATQQDLKEIQQECKNQREHIQILLQKHNTYEQERNGNFEVMRRQLATMIDLQDRLKKLVAIYNMAIEDIPKYLSQAEASILPFQEIPENVVKFMKYCRELLTRHKNELKKRMNTTLRPR